MMQISKTGSIHSSRVTHGGRHAGAMEAEALDNDSWKKFCEQEMKERDDNTGESGVEFVVEDGAQQQQQQRHRRMLPRPLYQSGDTSKCVEVATWLGEISNRVAIGQEKAENSNFVPPAPSSSSSSTFVPLPPPHVPLLLPPIPHSTPPPPSPPPHPSSSSSSTDPNRNSSRPLTKSKGKKWARWISYDPEA
ncbi:hypothetical protein BDA99DRAFT_565198 [Phascolomyces articulosus]|uniref:Uncharacterized protein n=1 Tax=Phascolomyces articulosus TaxID=60185 RepID=A0AAD5JP84_9FUNG|nr:hypothetical protein BDA99DRAFT_565198 [Phascolomyces articulosus]